MAGSAPPPLSDIILSLKETAPPLKKTPKRKHGLSTFRYHRTPVLPFLLNPNSILDCDRHTTGF